MSRLDRARTSSPLGTAVARILLVDDVSAEGAVVDLVVSVRSGAGGRGPLVEPDCARAVALVVAALGVEGAVDWELRDAPFPVRGASLGLGVAVALEAIRRGRAVPTDWAFTGSVSVDRTLVRIRSLPEKLRAAAAAGVRVVAIPEENVGVVPPEGLELRPFRDVSTLADALFGPERSPSPSTWPTLAALLAGPVLAWTGALSAPEIVLQEALLRQLDPLPSTATAIAWVPEVADLRRLRASYPAWLDALRAAGALTVSFDIAFSAASPDDEAFATAVRSVKAAGMPVLAPVRCVEGTSRAPETTALREALTLGRIEIETEGWRQVDQGRIEAQPWCGSTPLWHLSVATVAARNPRLPEPTIEGAILTVGERRTRLAAGRYFLRPVGVIPSFPLDRPSEWPDLTGRSVFIGSADVQDQLVAPTGLVSGVVLHAAAVEVLVSGRAPAPVGEGIDTLVALFAGGLGRATGRVPRGGLLGAFAGALGLSLLVVLGTRGVMVSVLPALLGGVVAWAVGRR